MGRIDMLYLNQTNRQVHVWCSLSSQKLAIYLHRIGTMYRQTKQTTPFWFGILIARPKILRQSQRCQYAFFARQFLLERFFVHRWPPRRGMPKGPKVRRSHSLVSEWKLSTEKHHLFLHLLSKRKNNHWQGHLNSSESVELSQCAPQCWFNKEH